MNKFNSSGNLQFDILWHAVCNKNTPFYKDSYTTLKDSLYFSRTPCASLGLLRTQKGSLHPGTPPTSLELLLKSMDSSRKPSPLPKNFTHLRMRIVPGVR